MISDSVKTVHAKQSTASAKLSTARAKISRCGIVEKVENAKMNPTPPRNSNIILCYALIFAGVLCMIGTIFLAIYLKNGIIERAREPAGIEDIGDGVRIQFIEQQIKLKEQSIEFEKRRSDADERLRKSKEEIKKYSNNKTEVNQNTLNIWGNQAERIKQLEDEKAKLIAEKDDLQGKMRAREMKPRTWGEWADDYNLELLLGGVLPLGLFSFYLMRFLLGGRLPNRNPLSLTDFERKCVLFLPFSIVFSAFGFFVFVWILTITY